jgi:hypothetical protein
VYQSRVLGKKKRILAMKLPKDIRTEDSLVGEGDSQVSDTLYNLVKDAIKGTGVTTTGRSCKDEVDLTWDRELFGGRTRQVARAKVESCPGGLIVTHQVVGRYYEPESIERAATVTVCTATQLPAVIKALERTHTHE